MASSLGSNIDRLVRWSAELPADTGVNGGRWKLGQDLNAQPSVTHRESWRHPHPSPTLEHG